MATQITLENYEEEIENSKVPVVIDFYADWCGPCKLMGPVFEEVSKDFEGKMKFVKVNIDSNGGLATKFGVRSIPTLIFLNSGKEIDRSMGFPGEDGLRKKVQEVLSKI